MLVSILLIQKNWGKDSLKNAMLGLLGLSLIIVQAVHLGLLEQQIAPTALKHELAQALYILELWMIAPCLYVLAQQHFIKAFKFSALHLVMLCIPIIASLFSLLQPQSVGFLYFLGQLLALSYTAAFIYQRQKQTHSRFLLKTNTLALFVVSGLLLFLAFTLSPLLFSWKAALVSQNSVIALALFMLLGIHLNYSALKLASKANKPKSQLKVSVKGLDFDQIEANLSQLMKYKRLYEDPSLNLAGLAKALNLSSQQLSAFVNRQLEMGFAKYLRTVRVQASKRYLIETPERSILSISSHVGFNSSTSFHQAFIEVVGMPPSAFRQLKHVNHQQAA